MGYPKTNSVVNKDAYLKENLLSLEGKPEVKWLKANSRKALFGVPGEGSAFKTSYVVSAAIRQ